MKKMFIGCALAIASHLSVASAQQQPARWITEGPQVDAASISLELPVERLATKLYVEVEIGGTPRRFVFDTGSPSMISRALAAELGLAVVDRRQGRDSHGAVIESEIVQAELTLGGVTFRKVPMFATDFSASSAAQCLVGDGVLGSEILPLCAWQIDLPDSVIRCNTDVDALDHVGKAPRERLHDFGYPHAPILEIRIGKDAHSKAMFDTGSPDYFTISPPDFEGTRRAGGVGGVVSGHGSLGGSLGGQAPEADHVRAELKSLSIGDLALGAVDSVVRESPPSLIGASLLEHFVITLDTRSESAWFDSYREGPHNRPSFGFTLALDGDISVGLVWEDSPAAAAGLSTGTRLTAINGVPTDPSCAGIHRALEAMSGSTIELAWEGGSAALARKSRLGR
jgi:hypothetical protein